MTTSDRRFLTRSATALPDVREVEKTSSQNRPSKGWIVIVWNDHINTMSYVVHVFRKVLGFNKEKAHSHMMEVHVQGRSCVAKESREKAEFYWDRLQGYGLRVTLQQSD
jgi:ATP-dependent Clp protease adaptor protein ClpS